MRALFPEDKDYTDVFAEHPIPTHTVEEFAVKENGSERSGK